MEKSFLEYAYEKISTSKKALSFNEVWDYVAEHAGLDEATKNNKVAQFYTDLMLDGRFVTLGNNTWDLRERQTFDKVHIDMRDVYNEINTTESANDDEEEKKDEEDYNKPFEDPNKDDDNENGDDNPDSEESEN